MIIDALKKKIFHYNNVSTTDLITKIDSVTFDVHLLTKEFIEIIKSELIPIPSADTIQSLHHLILSGKASLLYDKLDYTKTVIRSISNVFDFKDVTYRALQPNRAYNWHRDNGKMCIHIPLITNFGCRFVYDNISFFMPADGSAYKVYNKDYHTFVNAGKTPRIHLMFENL